MGTDAKSVSNQGSQALSLVDTSGVMELFQRRLPGFAEGRFVLDWLKVKYIWKEPGSRHRVLYKSWVKEVQTGREGRQEFFGMVEPNGQSYDLFAKANLGVGFEPEFGPSVYFLEELNMVLWGYPNEPELTGLPRLVQDQSARKFFRDHWKALRLPSKNTILNVQTQKVKYVPLWRCTLRHDLMLQGNTQLTVYSKTLNRDASGAQIFRVMHTLWKYLHDSSGTIQVPEPFFFAPDMNAIFVRGLEGESIDEYLHEVDLGRICEEIGAGLAKVQGCPIEGLARRADDNILTKLDKALTIIEKSNSPYQPRLKAVTQELKGKYQNLTVVPPTPTHGAFRMTQLLRAGDHLALIDFDDFLLGNPIADVSSFVGSLLFYPLEGKLTHDQSLMAIHRFCRAYAEHSNWGLPEDVLVWETAANLVCKHVKKCVTRPKDRRRNVIEPVLDIVENLLSGKLQLI